MSETSSEDHKELGESQRALLRFRRCASRVSLSLSLSLSLSACILLFGVHRRRAVGRFIHLTHAYHIQHNHSFMDSWIVHIFPVDIYDTRLTSFMRVLFIAYTLGHVLLLSFISARYAAPKPHAVRYVAPKPLTGTSNDAPSTSRPSGCRSCLMTGADLLYRRLYSGRTGGGVASRPRPAVAAKQMATDTMMNTAWPGRREHWHARGHRSVADIHLLHSGRRQHL